MEIVIIGILVMCILISGLIYNLYTKQHEQLETIIETLKNQNRVLDVGIHEELRKIENNTNPKNR